MEPITLKMGSGEPLLGRKFGKRTTTRSLKRSPQRTRSELGQAPLRLNMLGQARESTTGKGKREEIASPEI